MSKFSNSINKYIYAASFLGLSTYAVVAKKNGVARLKKIKKQLVQSDAISKISSDMIAVNTDNINKKIMQFLESVGNYYDVDRVGIMLLSPDGFYLKYEVEWCSPGIDPAIGRVNKIFVDGFWLSEQIENRNVCVISDEINSITAREKLILKSLGVKTILSAPIETNDKLYGFLIIQSVEENQIWRDDQKRTMTVLANILGDAYLKADAEKEINRLAF